MVRLKKEKGKQLPHSFPDKKQPSVKSTPRDEKATDTLKQQVRLLGGDDHDLELLKDSKDNLITDNVAEDPVLDKDVANFLNGLKPKPNQKARTSALDSSKSKDRREIQNGGKKPGPKSSPQKLVPESSQAKPQAPSNPQSKPLRSGLLVEPSPQWYSSLPPLPKSTNPVPTITSTELSSLVDHASSLHSSATLAYQSKSSTVTSSNSEFSFLQKILGSGTLSDRLSALTLLVQSSPLHNVKALETLKSMAERGKGKGGREESLKALRCIIDWWVGGGAPSRKLKYFRDQPLLHPSVTDQHLLVWYFEDWLKKFFFSVLQTLETLSLDPLTYVRTQAISLIYTLLREKPEQEHNLLRLLVNKLGDSDKSICSRASYHLLQLLQAHPSMKTVIIREMTSLILRPTSSTAATAPPATNTHIRFADESAPSTSASASKPKPKLKQEKPSGNDHVRYYATITFNQVVFGPGDKEVAVQVIDVYFQMFKDLLGEGQISNPVDGAVTVEPKAAQAETKGGEKKKDAGKAKGEEKKKRKAGKEVVGDAGFAEVEDAQSKLVSAILTGVNRALPYAKLSASDVGLNKHIDTLFLITHTSTFNISLQALLLIQQIASSLSLSSPSTPSSLTQSITSRYFRTLYSSLHDARLAFSSKQTMYLNLLFKSLKADEDLERVKAFIRRFVQVLVSGGAGATEFIVGGLYLLGELFGTVPGLRKMIEFSPPAPSDDSHDEVYDPRKRDPQFSHASSSPFYELLPLLHHFHPTVSLHAQQLLSAQPVTSSADLSLNTLSHFLDRFVYKNPTKKSKPKGASAMQPAASANDGIGVKRVKGEARDGVLVNDEKFWKKKVTDVAADEVFFHKFFSRKNEKEKGKPTKVEESGDEDGADESEEEGHSIADDDEEDREASGENEEENDEENDEEDSDAEEAEIWKAMQATMPPMAGDEDLMEDSDSDEIPSGLDDDDDDDDEPEGESDRQDEDDEGSADALSLAEGSDNEDLVDIDDIPQGLIDFDGSDSENGEDGAEEEWGGFSGADNGKRKREDESKGSKRKKLKSLPTFASYEDYAKMIEDGPEDDI
ncbi:CBF-domain-containing protein [Leucogyrophana mollusca]|uniref:CBF-domain-containing protein n=1 Tax=Leucogyrophana mollusca TaxID=85980 RepID=A0ACB8B434_9AGAM|nr:CBF-domain-containing protein [Leucogyrophana mollusca]